MDETTLKAIETVCFAAVAITFLIVFVREM